MYLIFLASEIDAIVAQEVVNQAPANDIIGIGGIVATLLVGMVTCLVTWKLTLKSIKQLKMSYNIQFFPILSNSVTKGAEINLDDLKIQYRDKVLSNPCLLALEIVNSGNDAINNPPIKIRTDENIEIIPGYFEDVPAGYEGLWSFSKETPNSCNIQLEHLNPKQVAKIRFFLDNLPQNKIVFECPMQNLQIQEVAYNNANTGNKITISSKSNILLMCITALLFLSIDQWKGFTELFINIFDLRIHPDLVSIFIILTLVLVIIFNACGIPIADKYIKSPPKQATLIKVFMILASIILLVLTICDYIIVGILPQVITGIIVIIMLSLLIHFSFVSRSR